jgi:two-component system, NarL family, response regulator NreC
MKILVVDDHSLIRKGMKQLLNSYHPEWEVHEANNGIQAIVMAPRIKPDIVLLDYSMPKLNGAKAARQLIHDLKSVKIIMISGFISSMNIQMLLGMGVMGIISKSAGTDVILEAIFTVRGGRHYLAMDAMGSDFDESPEESIMASGEKKLSQLLTERELEIMHLLIKGYRADMIAQELAISKKTLSAHKVNIFRKCQVHSTVELLRYSYKNNLT